MYPVYFILSVFLFNVRVSALPFEDLYKLDIIHYNDFHVRFEETSVENPICRTDDTSCLGGFARLYHEIQVLLEEKPEAILLNAGDSFRGTYWDTLYKWVLVQQFMNLLPHDAHALGNHEFDYGPDGIVPYLLGLNAPALVANMDVTNEPSLQGLFKPRLVVERKGRKIGIIGLITTETKNITTPGDIEFTDPHEATLREAQALIDEGVDIIIVLSHCGLDVDKELALHYGHYIDIIIGAHSHSVLWNEESSPSGEPVDGPYPIIVENDLDVTHKTLVVQAGAHTKYMGNLSVYFDDSGNLVQWEGGPIFLNRSIPEDSKIKSMLAPYAELVRKAQDVPVGQISVALHFEDCLLGECALGNALADAQNEYARLNIKSDLPYLSFRQRERIHLSLREGTITEGVLYELLPNDDRMETFELQGKFVLEALERSLMGASSAQPFSKEWSLQISGLRVVYNLSNPEGERVISVLIQDGGSTLDVDAIYQITTPTYLGNGANGFTMFKDHKRNVLVIGREQNIIKSYIKKYSPLNVAVDGRVTFI